MNSYSKDDLLRVNAIGASGCARTDGASRPGRKTFYSAIIKFDSTDVVTISKPVQLLPVIVQRGTPPLHTIKQLGDLPNE